jgi:hypothetical protein
VHATSLVMAPAAWSVLVPLRLASLLTGLGLSLGTTWGLFRHYWVLLKLLINAIATILVLEYAQTLSDIAGVAADPTLADDDFVVLLGALQRASGGLLLVLLATVLAVYKPRGMTRYGQRKQHGQRRKQHERTAPVPETGDSPTHFAANP